MKTRSLRRFLTRIWRNRKIGRPLPTYVDAWSGALMSCRRRPSITWSAQRSSAMTVSCRTWKRFTGFWNRVAKFYFSSKIFETQVRAFFLQSDAGAAMRPARSESGKLPSGIAHSSRASGMWRLFLTTSSIHYCRSVRSARCRASHSLWNTHLFCGTFEARSIFGRGNRAAHGFDVQLIWPGTTDFIKRLHSLFLVTTKRQLSDRWWRRSPIIFGIISTKSSS